jgi:tryptophan synthase beta chain
MTTATAPRLPSRFGPYGGTYVPETLVSALEALEDEYVRAKSDPAFVAEFEAILRDFVGRPSRLFYAQRLSEKLGGAKIYLKREDLNHTGAHKINNTIGQGLLCRGWARSGSSRDRRRPARRRHASGRGLLRAAVRRLHGRRGREAAGTQRLPHEMMGANVIEVQSGSKTLKDATNEAMRDWMGSVGHTHYIIGSVVGPHPFPTIVRDFQSMIGTEAPRTVPRDRGQTAPTSSSPASAAAATPRASSRRSCRDESVKLVGVEAGG